MGHSSRAAGGQAVGRREVDGAATARGRVGCSARLFSMKASSALAGAMHRFRGRWRWASKRRRVKRRQAAPVAGCARVPPLLPPRLLSLPRPSDRAAGGVLLARRRRQRRRVRGSHAAAAAALLGASGQCDDGDCQQQRRRTHFPGRSRCATCRCRPPSVFGVCAVRCGVCGVSPMCEATQPPSHAVLRSFLAWIITTNLQMGTCTSCSTQAATAGAPSAAAR